MLSSSSIEANSDSNLEPDVTGRINSCLYYRLIIIMKSTKVQTLGRNIGTFGLETNLHAYVLGIYRTPFQHNLHCFIDACVHVVNDYIVSN